MKGYNDEEVAAILGENWLRHLRTYLPDMSMTTPSSISPDTSPESIPSRFRIRSGLFLTLCGLLVFLVGARPAIFGLDRSPVVGFVQIAVFLVGMAIHLSGRVCQYDGLLEKWRAVPFRLTSAHAW